MGARAERLRSRRDSASPPCINARDEEPEELSTASLHPCSPAKKQRLRPLSCWRPTPAPRPVLWCAAPPCQDFSRIAKGAGHQGDRGRLFEDSVAFMDELRAIFRQHRFAFLYENVEMDAAAAQVSSDALGVSPVFACPSDFGWVSRPRLWLLSVDWTRVVIPTPPMARP